MVRKATRQNLEVLNHLDQVTERRASKLRHAAQNRQRGLMVIMEDVHNPHNLAAIARSCDAFGVQQLAFTAQNPDLFDLDQVGWVTSAGATKWLDFRLFENGTADCFRTLHAEGWHIVATVAGSAIPSLYALDWTQPTYHKLAVLVGNEREGISDVARDLADSALTIPMQGMIQSFNVSVATAITLAEITRQRRASEIDFTIPADEAERLFHDFIHR